MKEEKNLAITLCQIKEEMEGKSLACVILQNKYEKAVTETEGKVIVWNKELKLVPYHELSAGQTRDGMEVSTMKMIRISDPYTVLWIKMQKII